MDNLEAILNKDLNDNRGCESCFAPHSTHVIFIHPKEKGGGTCGVFHICEKCSNHSFDFGHGLVYRLLEKPGYKKNV